MQTSKLQCKIKNYIGNFLKATSYKLQSKQGISIVEILIAIAIFSILGLAATQLMITSIYVNATNKEDIKASRLARECFEAVRSIRDQNFTLLQNGNFILKSTNGYYELVTGTEKIDNKFDRKVNISEIFRDSNFDIASSGTADPETKKIICAISWEKSKLGIKTITNTSYLTNWQNKDFLETLTTDFQEGTFTNTEAVSSDPPPVNNGVVTLQLGVSPSGFAKSINLGKKAIDVIVSDNYAFIAVEDESDGLQILDITDINNPKIIKEVNIDGEGTCIQIKDNYAYVGAAKQTKGLVIVDISNPENPNVVNSLNVGDKVRDIDIQGNYIYLALDNTSEGLKIIDITNPLSPVIKGDESTSGKAGAIAVQGNYAYIGTDAPGKGLDVIDISNINSPKLKTSLAIEGKGSGAAIYTNVLYMGVESSSKGLAVINISDPLNPIYKKSYDVGSYGTRISVLGHFAYVGTSTQNSGIAVFNITTPLDPTLALKQDVQGKTLGSYAIPGYIFITTNNNEKGLVIIGVPEEGFADTGEYMSKIFDSGSDNTVYYNLNIDKLISPAGQLKVQLRTGKTTGQINTAPFVGSNGTINTYYNNNFEKITLEEASSGSRYIQYKAFFTGDGNSSPVLNSVTINYRP